MFEMTGKMTGGRPGKGEGIAFTLVLLEEKWNCGCIGRVGGETNPTRCVELLHRSKWVAEIKLGFGDCARVGSPAIVAGAVIQDSWKLATWAVRVFDDRRMHAPAAPQRIRWTLCWTLDGARARGCRAVCLNCVRR